MQLQNATSKNRAVCLYETRKKFRDMFRKQEHQRLFQSVRKTLVDTKNQQITQNQEYLQNIPFQVNPPSPIPQNIQVNHQFLQFLQFYYQPAQLINQNAQYNQINRIQQFKPMIEQMMPQYKLQKIDKNKYFQKDGYIIYKKQLGKGTFSTVWQGMNIITRQKIAAKEVRIVQQNQVRCLANLKSNFIVKIYKIIKYQHKYFIILQFCENNLKEQLDNCEYSKQKVFHYFQQLIQGMDLLQSNNIIHRDLKFQNILVKDNTIKIADFGLAKFMEDQLEIESKRCGTPYTMAPEIYFSKSKKVPYSIKSDIWSLGIILHLMLYRKHPFNGKGQDLKLQKRAMLKRKYLILDKLIDKCLLYNPRERISWQQFKNIYSLHKRQQFQEKQQEQSILYKSMRQQLHEESQLIASKQKIQKNKQKFQEIKKEQILMGKIQNWNHKNEEKFDEYPKKQFQKQQFPFKREISRRKYEFSKNSHPLKPQIFQVNRPAISPPKKHDNVQRKNELKIQMPKMNSIRMPNNPPNSEKRIYAQIIGMFMFVLLLIAGNYYLS